MAQTQEILSKNTYETDGKEDLKENTSGPMTKVSISNGNPMSKPGAGAGSSSSQFNKLTHKAEE